MGFLHFYRAAILLPFLFHVSSSVYGQTTNATFDVTGHPSANIGVATGDDTLYTVDITLGGQNFTVLLDTGSSDLWINTQGRDIKLTNSTSLNATEVYGLGAVQGDIAFAELKVGDYVVPSQIFLNATQIANITTLVDGYMGISFDVGSIFGTVFQAWGNESAQTLGRSFITNLFAQNASLPNNFDLQLGRTNMLNETSTGTFIIGGHSSQFGDVTDAPKLPRVGNARWTVALDKMKINGEAFSFNKSSVSSVPEGSLVALLDSGFSIPQLPPAAVDAIYTSIPGAVFWQTGNSYIVPCNSTAMVSFVLGGEEFFVHPLDLTLPATAPIVMNGTVTDVTVCQATYQYFDLDPTNFAGFDLVLGDAFLRSVYASFDYNDTNPMTNTTGTPFVQLLSSVDVYTALDEFYEDRGEALSAAPPTIEPAQFIQFPLAISGASTTNSTSSQDNTPTTSTSSPNSVSTNSTGSQNSSVSGALSEAEVRASTGSASDGSLPNKTFKVAALALLGANLFIGSILLIAVLTMCVRGMKGRPVTNVGSRYVPVRFKDAENVDPEAEPAVPRYSD